MIRHVIIWDFNTDVENYKEKAQIAKEHLEALQGKIEGLIEMEVINDILDSSNASMMLDSLFVDKEALEYYRTHPLHVACGVLVHEVCKNRKCIDYEIE